MRRSCHILALLPLALMTAIAVTSPHDDAVAAESWLAPTGPSQSNSTGVWELLDPIPPRYAHASIYDPTRDRMVVFGGLYQTGCCGSMFGDDLWTVELSGLEPFHRLESSGSHPVARAAHTAILDPLRDRMIVFGGRDAGSNYLNDVWSVALGTGVWTQINPVGTPPAERWAHTTIYDPVRDRLIVFGGIAHTAEAFLNDVWALTLSGVPTWTQLAPTGPFPEGRGKHSAIYDPVRDRMVVHGGFGLIDPALTDTWALDLSSLQWTDITPGGNVVSGQAATYDAARDRMLIVHGQDVWALPFDPPGGLTLISTLPVGFNYYAPPTMIIDPTRDHLVLFGGQSIPYYWVSSAMPTLALDTGSWTIPPGGPASFEAGVYVPTRDWFVLLTTASVAIRPLSSPAAWFWPTTSTTPPSRRDAGIAYDAIADRVIIFGGAAGSTRFSDVWALSVSGDPDWSELTPAAPGPSAREGHSLVLDSLRNRLIAFGGVDDTGALNDVWELDLATMQWSAIAPAGPAPSARRDFAAIFDPDGDRMIIFGGVGLNDVWALSFSPTPSWQLLAPTGTPPPAVTYPPPHAALDLIGTRMVVTSGTQVWTLNLGGAPGWSTLTPAAGPPSTSEESTIAYDSQRDRLFFYAHYWGGGYTLPHTHEMWALTWGRVVDVPTHHAAAALLRLAPPAPNPSADAVTVRFDLPKAGPVVMKVLDVSGRTVATLVDRTLPAGSHQAHWSPTVAAPGVYFIELTTADAHAATRVVIMR